MFEQACKHGTQQQKKTAMEAYIQAQKKTREQIETYEAKKTEERVEAIVRKARVDPNTIWQARKRARPKGEIEYDTITEEGKTILEPEKALEHIANYFENLYQARPGTPEYEDYTQEIIETVRRVTKEYQDKPKVAEEITDKEMETAIKKLKRTKSVGPDEIPNEIFIEADKHTKKILKETINRIHDTEEIPESWLEGHIKRLYKGKGKKGKCSNERGITLASNIGKVYERILNERIKEKVNITEAQGGGITGNATVDHLVVLKEAMREIKSRGKTAYIVFLDVQKAYDKAWLDAILHTMYKNGVNGKNLEMMRKMNTNLTAKIQTKYGLTRRIKIKDSIRQGGVLSVIEYAALMDEITKEMRRKDQGLKMNNGEVLEDLLWMDDVALIHDNIKSMQKMLDTTLHVSLINHVEFGIPKCKVIRSGPGPKTQLEMNGKILEEVTAYKYLGDMVNSKGNLKDQITEIKKKIHAATQEILSETGNKEFKGMKMKAIWLLVETVIVPIITYGSEAWNATKQEMTQIEAVFNKCIKTLLCLPETTPTAIILAETGFLPIELIINKKKLLHAQRVMTKKKEGLINKIIKGDSIWRKEIRKIQEEYDIHDEDLTGKKNAIKTKINKKNKRKFEDYIAKEAENKSKVKHWLEMRDNSIPQGREKYMENMNRKQCGIILKVRSRMLPVQRNHGISQEKAICRLCKQNVEDQKHIIQDCTVTRINDNHNNYSRIFKCNDNDEMKIMADKLLQVEKTLTEATKEKTMEVENTE